MTSRTRGCVLALLTCLAAGCGAGASVEIPIEVTDTKGVVARIAAARGKPVVVNFWATWCAPCMAEMPDLMAGTRAFRERGGVVLGVAMEQMGDARSADEALERVRGAAPRLGLDFPLLVCTDDDMTLVRRVLGVELGGLPQTLVFDRRGEMVGHHEGRADQGELRELAERGER